jgi:hypothetical protein
MDKYALTTTKFQFGEVNMKKIRISSFILLVLLLVVLMGCNQPKVDTRLHDQNRIHEYPESLVGMAELFHENVDSFESLTANLLKNITSDKMILDIAFNDIKHQYEYTFNYQGTVPQEDRSFGQQPIGNLLKGEDILRFLKDFPVVEVEANESHVTIYLYDEKKYDGPISKSDYSDFRTYHYEMAGGFLQTKEDIEKAGVRSVLNDRWYTEDRSLANESLYELNEYGYLNYSLNLLKEDGFEVKEAVVTEVDLPQLGLSDKREAITGSINDKADYLFEINENCLLLCYERATQVTAQLINPSNGDILAEHQFSIPTNVSGEYRIMHLSDQLWVYAIRYARGNDQTFIPFSCNESGIEEMSTFQVPKEAASWMDGKLAFLTDGNEIVRVAYFTHEAESLVIRDFSDGKVQSNSMSYDLQKLGLSEKALLQKITYLGEERLVFSWSGNTNNQGGKDEYCGYGLLNPMSGQVQRVPFGGTNLLVSGNRILVGNSIIGLGQMIYDEIIDLSQPDVVSKLHQIYIINESGEPVVAAQPALSYDIDFDQGYKSEQLAVTVNGYASRKLGYAFAFFNTATDEWQKKILQLPEIYPLVRNNPNMENSHRNRFVATLSAFGDKIYIIGRHYDEKENRFTGYPRLITAQFPQ